MGAPEKPGNEIQRLQALHECALLDTPPEEHFDRLTRLAKSIFGTPVVLISLVDGERQWFKSRQGLEACETGRDISFCGHAILDDGIFQVTDAAKDPRFADNPLVTGSPRIRFYAGAPLKTPDGLRIGTLCLIDEAPRELTKSELVTLREIANCVESEIDLHRQRCRSQALMTLTRIASQEITEPKAALQKALALGCDYLCMPFGIVSRIVDDDYQVQVHVSPADTLEDNQHFPLGNTYCNLTLQKDTVLAIAHMGESEYAGHPCYQTFGLESYIGVPVRVQGVRYGTLNFSSPEARMPREFSQTDLEFVDHLGRWVSTTLQRWQLDQSLKAQQQLSQVIARVQSQFIGKPDRRQAFDGLLSDILTLTESEYGFIGEVRCTPDGNPYLKTYAITNIAWNDETRSFYEANAPQGMEFFNLNTLFGAALTSGEPVIANAPDLDPRRGGLPEGHPALDAFLGIPIFHGEGLVAMLGIANRPGGYDRCLVNHLKPLFSTIGQLIEAARIQQQHQADQVEIARLSRVASQTINGVVITDTARRVKWINEGFTRMSGYTLAEMAGKNPAALLHGPETDPATIEQMRDMLTRYQSFEVETVNYSRSGEPYWVHISCNPLLDAEGRLEGYMAIETDITERKRIDQMKNEFISTVSHELRTPLTSIRGALNLVLGKAGDQLEGKTKRMLEMAERNSERLTLLINDILDLEKIESGRMEFEFKVIDLVSLARRALEENEAFARQHQVQLVLETPLGEARVFGDEHRLLQVFANLISNAVKYSPQDGQVEVSIHRHAGGYRVDVRDDGCGIPEAFRQRIFQRFSQADSSDTREKGGTGLGLSICKAIIERHCGTIDYESQPGQGSRFYFELKSEHTSPVEGQVEPLRDRALICEYNAAVAHILAEVLGREDIGCDIVHTVAQARTMLRRNRYRLMLLDLLLPDGDGIELLEEIRSETATSQLPVVVVSGHLHENKKLITGDIVTIVDWLPKPVDQDRLKRAVDTALSRSIRPHILHVEDDMDIVQLVHALTEDTADLSYATCLEDARRKMAGHDYDLIIIDLGLEDGSGADLIDDIKCCCPVVIFSAQLPTREVSSRVNAALAKPFTSNDTLLTTIKTLMRRREYE